MAEEIWSDVGLTPLGEDDLADTIRELTDVAASWRNIGTQLGIRHNRLEAIQGEKPLDCLRQMLATWLQKNYNVERFGEPTWVKLVEAVSHSAGGGNPALAMKIARKYKATQSSPDVPGASEVDSTPLDGNGLDQSDQIDLPQATNSRPTQSATVEGEDREEQIGELQQEEEEPQQKDCDDRTQKGYSFETCAEDQSTVLLELEGNAMCQGTKRSQLQDDGALEPKRPKIQKRRSNCGKCNACQEKDCGSCPNCRDRQGPNKRHARCIKRKCLKLKYGPKEKDGQQQLGELTVQPNEHLGDGSFSTVYKASYQGKPVAPKYLYRQVRDKESFKRELETLKGLIHPNLVACRAALSPQRRDCPILVMGLMEKTLTEFLEEAENNIPVHLQVNLCLDVTFALAYLHSQQIVHGHLTSNNVLFVGTTAKVADFGLSKLLDMQSSVMQPASYLPPEVRVTNPEFSEKSDVFSLGVLVIQIITRELPTPTPQQQPDPLSEVDRRQQHIQKIASTHPLRDIALLCLKDTAMERPTVKKVVTKLTAVRYHPQYEDSLKQEREKAQQEIAQLKEKLKSKEKQILKQSQEREKQLGIAQEIAQLKEKLNSEEKSVLRQRQENQDLQQQLKDKDKKLEETETKLENESKKVQDRGKQIQACKKDIKKLQQQCKEKDVKISELKSTMDKIASLASAARQLS